MNVKFASISNNISFCPKHQHDCFEIIVVTDGLSEIIFDSVTYPLSKNSLIVIPPNYYHSHISQGTYSDVFIRIEDSCLPITTPTLLSQENNDVTRLCEILCSLFIQGGKNNRAITENLASAICNYIIKLTKHNCKYEFVHEFMTILAMNFSNQELCIRNESEKMGYNYDYMRHCFKDETGVTPLNYLTKVRIQQAQLHLIDNQYYSIGEIACFCGFTDKYYFSRCFKKIVGISPKDFREKHQQSD